MGVKDLIIRNRSYRRFHQDMGISRETLKDLVDLARLSGSGANMQPLKYIISCDAETNALVFPSLMWAGYLTDWEGPAEGERPSAYIIILCDDEISANPGIDHGIAAQSILLGATEQELGGCMIGSIHRTKLAEALSIPERYKILLVIALGKPKEHVLLENVGEDGSIKYWRDKKEIHHVPKRSLDEIILR